MSKRLTKSKIVNRASYVHEMKYDYSLFLDDSFIYKNISTKIPIICSKHGVFYKTVEKHLNGEGCPKCSKEKRVKSTFHITPDYFIEKAKEVHGDEYDYSMISECNCNTAKVPIICKKHGMFKQDYVHHVLRKQGCPVCGNIKSHSSRIKNIADFEKEANDVHNGKYAYNGDYLNSKSKIRVICPIHGEFEQEAESHLQGHGCPKCGIEVSKDESEIYDFLCNELGKENVLSRQYGVIDNSELDIYMPSKNIAIEYNGLRWHSEEFGKDRNYHLNKLKKCNEKGIGLIQIFEDEFHKHKDIVFSKLKHILGISNKLPRIFARRTEVREIPLDDAKYFLNNNHIQGFEKSTVYVGAFLKGCLIGVMSFVQREENMWELNRFATDIRAVCCGVGGKLFKYFIKNYNPNEVKSFADRRWTLNSDNNLYTKLGFTLEKTLRQDYRYFNDRVGRYLRIHKFNFRKKILSEKYGFPLSMTESEMAKKLGYTRIWDCGLFKYIWKKKP